MKLLYGLLSNCILVLSLVVSVSCNESQGPLPPVNPPSPPPEDFTQYPVVEAYGGQLTVSGGIVKAFTAFTLPITSRQYASDMCIVAQQHGLNTARVFIEARNWTHAPGYLAQVAFDYDPIALEEIAHGLGQAGCAMQLVLNATAKEESTIAGLSLISQGMKQFRDWPNVLYSMCNEYKHPSSVYDTGDAKAFLEHANSLCPECIIGIDEALRDIRQHRACGPSRCDYIAWHPNRNNPDIENSQFFNRIATMSWGKPTFHDELIAYASDQNFQDYPTLKNRAVISCNGSGTEQCRYEHANEVYNMVLDSGANPCWHTIDHMLCLIAPSAMAWPQEH